MSKITVSPEEFADIVVCFLYDQLRNEDGMLPNNEEWQAFSKLLKQKGVGPISMQYYTGLNTGIRMEYKRIKDMFHKSITGNSTIIIRGPQEPIQKSPEKKSKVKDIVKKVVRLLKNERKRTGWPINEEKMDKIIEYVVEQEEKEK